MQLGAVLGRMVQCGELLCILVKCSEFGAVLFSLMHYGEVLCRLVECGAVW